MFSFNKMRLDFSWRPGGAVGKMVGCQCAGSIHARSVMWMVDGSIRLRDQPISRRFYPADAWHDNNVISMSKRSCHVFWRNNDVIIASRVCWELYPATSAHVCTAFPFFSSQEIIKITITNQLKNYEYYYWPASPVIIILFISIV